MTLKKYSEKRNFKITSEPKPRKRTTNRRAKKNNKWMYVIQKHAASQLHYDLRLEIDGVLKSWAVPRGPSLNPTVKRLAVETEDHPIEYGSFEGIIPEGEYGGGTVMLWDKGIYTPQDEPKSAYHKGDITFELQGTKLKGFWKLIRMKSRLKKSSSKTKGGSSSKMDDSKKLWLLIKLPDEYAKKVGDILKKEPLSVVSKRNMDEIAEDRTRIRTENKSGKANRTRIENRANISNKTAVSLALKKMLKLKKKGPIQEILNLSFVMQVMGCQREMIGCMK